MSTVLIDVRAIGELRPGSRALDTGGADGREVTVHALGRINAPMDAGPAVTLRVSSARERRFRWFDLIVRTRDVWFWTGYGLVAAAFLMWGIPWLAAAILLPIPLYLKPRGYPRTSRDAGSVELSNVDESAALEWQAANPAGVVTFKTADAVSTSRWRWSHLSLALAVYVLIGLWLAQLVMTPSATVQQTRVTELLSWQAGDRGDFEVVPFFGSYLLTATCTGGGRMTLTSNARRTVLAETACDGSVNQTTVAQKPPPDGLVIQRYTTGDVADWKVTAAISKTEDVSERPPPPAWTLVLPILGTVVCGLLVLQLMRISVRFRSIAPERLEDFSSSLSTLGNRLGGPLSGPITSLIAIGIQALLFTRWF